MRKNNIFNLAIKKLLLLWIDLNLGAPSILWGLIILFSLFFYIFVPDARTIALLLPIVTIGALLFFHIITIIVIWLVGDWNNVDWT